MNTQAATTALISIIVPVYNVEEYLPKCLESILAQTYGHLEIILVDDGSTDGSGAICDSYAAQDHRITVLHQANQGVAAARNAGLDRATGDYIGWVDPDDWVTPLMYEKLLRLCENTGADIAQCGVLLDSAAASTDFSAGHYEAPGADILRLAIQGKFAQTLWCNLYAAGIWHGLRFPAGYCYEDQMLLPDISARCGKIAVTPEKLYCYVRRATGIVRQEKNIEHLRSKEKCVEFQMERLDTGGRNRELIALYFCMIIASYRLMIEPNKHISASASAVHNKKMRALFQSFYPLARQSVEYRKMPLVKKIYWYMFSATPNLANVFLKLSKRAGK